MVSWQWIEDDTVVVNEVVLEQSSISAASRQSRAEWFLEIWQWIFCALRDGGAKLGEKSQGLLLWEYCHGVFGFLSMKEMD